MEIYKTESLIEVTKKEFSPYHKELLSDDEARTIQKNLLGIVELLINWSNDTSKAAKE